MTIKMRSLPLSGWGPMSSNIYTGSTLSSHTSYVPAFRGKQQTNTRNNPISLLGKSNLNIGGYFSTQKVEWQASPSYANVRSAGFTSYEYVGSIFAKNYTPNPAFDTLPNVKSDFVMSGYGTTGISRALPTNPLSGMGQFIGELRDLPRVPFKDFKKKSAGFKSLARNGSDEYLNVVFGWVPFVSDVRDFAKVTANSSKLAANFSRNSGKDVRRRSTVFRDSSTTVLDLGVWYGSPALPLAVVSKPGKLTLTTLTETEIYFSGAFTYYLPSGDDFVSKMKRYESLANHLYGTRLSPDLLWKLAPWSWAADWVSNAGDIVRNWSAFANDGLVMHYGYVMAETTITETWSGQDMQLINGAIIGASERRITSVKQRSVATPFGFGLDPGAFSPKQWSIIAALGFSKAPRSLNF